MGKSGCSVDVYTVSVANMQWILVSPYNQSAHTPWVVLGQATDSRIAVLEGVCCDSRNFSSSTSGTMSRQCGR